MEKRIRSIEVTDAQAVCDIYAPFVSDSATSFEAIAPDASEIERRIGEITPKHPWLIFEAAGSVLGYAYACAHRTRHAYQWSADVSVYIHEGARNRRVGQALYTALFHLLRRQGYFNAYSGNHTPESRQRAAARIAGLFARRRLLAHRFQVREVARCVVASIAFVGRVRAASRSSLD